MDKSQWYIGTKNGVVLCIDQVEKKQLKGRFYHRYQVEANTFCNTEQMLFKLEMFYDSIHFPYPSTTGRTFLNPVKEKEKNQEKVEKMSDRDLLKKHGELGTFIVRVQHRQNSSWQGRITWMEEDQTVCFRSIWEMLKLIASVVELPGTEKETEEKEPSWFDMPKEAGTE